MSAVPRLLQSCFTLTHSERVALLAAFLREHPVWNKKFRPISDPGVCQLCGHTLKVAYRAYDLRKNPVECHEIAPDAKDVPQIQVWLGERMARHHETMLSHPDWLLIVPVHACTEVEGQAIWEEALRFNQKTRV